MKSIKASAPDRKKRRMDKNTPVGQKNKLTVDESILDRKRYEYRFVNDVDGNIAIKQSQDWDIAEIHESVTVGDAKAGEAQSDGTVIRKPVGGGVTAVLMCKKREWYKEDSEKKEQALREIENEMNDKEKIEQKLKKIE